MSWIKKIMNDRLFWRYALVGGAVTLLELVLLFIFKRIFGWYYLTGSIAAYACGFFLTFFWRKYWVFKDYTTHRLSGQLLLYLLVFIASLAANTLLMIILVERFHVFYLRAQLFGGIASGLIGFRFNQDLTFGENER